LGETERLTFLKKAYPHAKEVERETGFNAVALLAQAAAESGWGESAPGNMYFGVKAHSHPRRQLIRTKEYHNTPDRKYPVIHSITKSGDMYLYDVEDWFREYDSPRESFKDHADFLLSNQRYAEALKRSSNPKRFLSEIARAGYATRKDYADFMSSMVDSVERRLKKLGFI